MTMRSYTAEELIEGNKLDPKITTIEQLKRMAVRVGLAPQKKNGRNFWLFNEFDVQAINKYINRMSARKVSRDLQKSYPLPQTKPKIHPERGWGRFYASL
jgi:hypothetical protein